VEIAPSRVTNSLGGYTSNRLHMRAATGDVVFDQKREFMKQSTYQTTRLLEPSMARLILVLLSFAALTLSTSSCVTRQRKDNISTQSPATASRNQIASEMASNQRLNINTASAKELEKLPGIGKVLAARIVEHREKYGLFRRPEHLIMVRGISDKRFRTLRDLITVE
jgi:competence ComEA-like helix-hairpin-helix protein